MPNLPGFRSYRKWSQNPRKLQTYMKVQQDVQKQKHNSLPPRNKPCNTKWTAVANISSTPSNYWVKLTLNPPAHERKQNSLSFSLNSFTTLHAHQHRSHSSTKTNLNQPSRTSPSNTSIIRQSKVSQARLHCNLRPPHHHYQGRDELHAFTTPHTTTSHILTTSAALHYNTQAFNITAIKDLWGRATDCTYSMRLIGAGGPDLRLKIHQLFS